MVSLVKLILRNIGGRVRPSCIGRLESLQELSLEDKKTAEASSGRDRKRNLASLIELSLRNARLESPPPSIDRLQSLQCLLLTFSNSVSSLSSSIGRLSALEELNTSFDDVTVAANFCILFCFIVCVVYFICIGVSFYFPCCCPWAR